MLRCALSDAILENVSLAGGLTYAKQWILDHFV